MWTSPVLFVSASLIFSFIFPIGFKSLLRPAWNHWSCCFERKIWLKFTIKLMCIRSHISRVMPCWGWRWLLVLGQVHVYQSVSEVDVGVYYWKSALLLWNICWPLLHVAEQDPLVSEELSADWILIADHSGNGEVGIDHGAPVLLCEEFTAIVVLPTRAMQTDTIQVLMAIRITDNSNLILKGILWKCTCHTCKFRACAN